MQFWTIWHTGIIFQCKYKAFPLSVKLTFRFDSKKPQWRKYQAFHCCATFHTLIDLLLKHLTLWDSSSVREMSSLLLFLSSKCFKCFLHFLCFLWDLCFLWPCFFKCLDFGDCGWPTGLVGFVDWGDMLESLCSMKWIWFLLFRCHILFWKFGLFSPGLEVFWSRLNARAAVTHPS